LADLAWSYRTRSQVLQIGFNFAVKDGKIYKEEKLSLHPGNIFVDTLK